MPMDERTEAVVRALLDRYPRGYVAEAAGFTVTNTAAGLFPLLCLSVLAEDSVPADPVVAAVRALFERRWDSAGEMAKSNQADRIDVLAEAGYHRAGDGGRVLGEATAAVLDRYQGDLQNLRRLADGDSGRPRAARRDPRHGRSRLRRVPARGAGVLAGGRTVP